MEPDLSKIFVVELFLPETTINNKKMLGARIVRAPWRADMKRRKRNMFMFWFLSFTWSIVTTLAGFLLLGILCLCGKRPKRFGPAFVFDITKNCGVSVGPTLIVSKRSGNSLRCHELGHHLQSCYKYGPFWIFAVAIPSVIRFHMRDINCFEKKRKFSLLISLFVFSALLIPTVIFFENKFMVLSTIFFLLLSYWACVAAWLLFSELPKYKNGKFPNYYAIWFEREASDMGLNFMLSIRENLNDGNKI